MDLHAIEHLLGIGVHFKLMLLSVSLLALTASFLVVLLGIESYLRASQKEWYFGRTKKRLAD